jgi:hypothetical protein
VTILESSPPPLPPPLQGVALLLLMASIATGILIWFIPAPPHVSTVAEPGVSHLHCLSRHRTLDFLHRLDLLRHSDCKWSVAIPLAWFRWARVALNFLHSLRAWAHQSGRRGTSRLIPLFWKQNRPSIFVETAAAHMWICSTFFTSPHEVLLLLLLVLCHVMQFFYILLYTVFQFRV